MNPLTIIAWLMAFGLSLSAAAAGVDQLGDLDGDGVATVRDLVLLRGHMNKTQPLSEEKAVLADLNKDGFVNQSDVDELVKEILQTRTPETLPLATVRESSPASGEGDVALTRETIMHFSIPLSPGAALDTTKFYASFGGRKILSRVEISSDRKKATLFYLEPLPSNARVNVTLDGTGLTDLLGRDVDLDGDGVAGGTHAMTFDTLSITAVAGTAISGRVFASEPGQGAGGATVDVPLAGVTVSVDGAEETLQAVTDVQGNFTLNPSPAGSFFVHIDGRTSPQSSYPNGNYYPTVGKRWEALAGRTDNLSGNSEDTSRGTIYLPKIITGTMNAVSQVQDTTVDLPAAALAAHPEMAGTRLNVPANSLFADDGTRGGKVGIAPVAPDRLPSPLPPGLNLPMVVTVQTDGASNFDRPVPIAFPNLPDSVTGKKLAPGEKSALWSFNHDVGEWEVVGPMTVSENGNFVISDVGVGIRQPGWHGTNPATQGQGGGLSLASATSSNDANGISGSSDIQGDQGDQGDQESNGYEGGTTQSNGQRDGDKDSDKDDNNSECVIQIDSITIGTQPFQFTSDSAISVFPNVQITISASAQPPGGGKIEWEAVDQGQINSGTGSDFLTFTTKFNERSTNVISRTITLRYKVDSVVKCSRYVRVEIHPVSGSHWCPRFNVRTTTDHLQSPFHENFMAFLSAIQNARMTTFPEDPIYNNTAPVVQINSVFRPAARAYLMHYCCEISDYYGRISPESLALYLLSIPRFSSQNIQVPQIDPSASFEISWAHFHENGSVDVDESFRAAQAMMSGYDIVHGPALISNHTKGLAVDMTFSWQGTLNIATHDGQTVSVSGPGSSKTNSSLWTVGRGYQVLKLAEDPPHWSSNGH